MTNVDKLIKELRTAIRAEVVAELLGTLAPAPPVTRKRKAKSPKPARVAPQPTTPTATKVAVIRALKPRTVACSKCRRPGHNAKTCKEGEEISDEELDRRALIKLRAAGQRAA